SVENCVFCQLSTNSAQNDGPQFSLAPSLKKAMSNQQQPANIIFRVQQTLGVWEPEPQLSPTCSLSVLHAVLPVRPAHTRLVLQHKQLPHQIVNLNLVRKPDWFLAKSAPAKTRTRSRRCTPATPGSGRAMPLGCWQDGRPPSFPAFYRWAMRERRRAEGRMGVATRRPNAAAGPAGRFELFLATATRCKMADLMIWPWIERLPVAAKMLGFQLPRGQYRQALKAGTGSSRGKNVLMETAPNTWSLGSRSRSSSPTCSPLYSMRFLPHQAAAATEIVNLNLVRKNADWFLAKSAFRKSCRLCRSRRLGGIRSQLVSRASSRGCSPTLGDIQNFYSPVASRCLDGRPHDLAMVRAA
uniref:Ig-like domain-containing protein n=1 Tax=Macrostomum lignano TaxID=282301 RepID=A0A1I8FP90_9PLAT